uniref:Phenoloxidase-activating factor 1-like n=1 Tax=Diabrotica virgifera virgifera TaxID=50390 RepID=A0A6P7G9F4_DIAVI
MSGKCFILFAYVLYVGVFKIVDAQHGQPIKRARNPHISTTSFTRSPAIPDRKTCGFQDPHFQYAVGDPTESRLPIGKMPRLRVVGGIETSLEEHPWMALLGYKNRSGAFNWKCGGTLISQRYVLTAAHCVTGSIEDVYGKLTYVKLGVHNSTTLISCDIHRDCNEKTVIRGIESFSFHKNYDKTKAATPNDIAVIRLNQTVEYSTYIRPICLAEPYEESKINDRLTTVGWGKTENGECSQVKLKVDVPLRTNQYCTEQYIKKLLIIILSDSQICAGGEQGRDTCDGKANILR